MSELKGHLALSVEAINCFADDGRLDADELGRLIALAERDGVIDQDEIRVLRGIIARIQPEEVDDALRARLQELAQKVAASGKG